MFKFILIASVAFVCVAAGNPNDAHAQILKQSSDLHEDGSYNYAYETSNGIAAGEVGVGGQYASGSYSFYSPEGELFEVAYKADENGFQPSGKHLPTPPPIPAGILKGLEYIRTHPQYVEGQHQQHQAPRRQHHGRF